MLFDTSLRAWHFIMVIWYVFVFVIKLKFWIIDAFIVLYKYTCHVYNSFNIILVYKLIPFRQNKFT